MASGVDERLVLIVERIERLLEERAAISQDIRDVYAEAKAVGYDARMVREVIARRAMKPEDRAEREALLEVYEAAVGLAPAEGVPGIEDMRPDAAALAASLLAAEIVELEDPEKAAALCGHVLALLDVRAEIAGLRADERARVALAKLEGFDPKQVKVTVRWFEKCAQHGEAAMRLGEQTFHLYRGTIQSRPTASLLEAGNITSDPKLAAAFAPKRTAPKGDKMGDILASIAASKEAEG